MRVVLGTSQRFNNHHIPAVVLSRWHWKQNGWGLHLW